LDGARAGDLARLPPRGVRDYVFVYATIVVHETITH
jgi:hypothetical protein